MSLDDDLSALAAHRLELESWEDAARRQEADDEYMARAEYEDRKACESVEAAETMWTGVMKAQPDWMRNVTYRERKRGYDSRLWGP